MTPLRPAVMAPITIGAAMLVAGRTGAGVALITIGAAFALLGIASPAVGRRVEAAIARAALQVGRLVGVAAWTVVGIAVVGAALVGRLLGADPLGRRSPRGWLPTATAAGGARSGGVARRRVFWRTTIGVLGFLGLVAAVVVVARDRAADPSPEPAASVPIQPIEPPLALRGQVDIGRTRQEEGAVFARMEADPVVGWRLPETATGTDVTVEHHRRTSVQSASGGPVIWFFGGSTMFGSNQRDGHTIPSEFARAAAEDGRPVQVVNWGVHAYTAYQEAQLLQVAVADVGPPDLVIFYDGYNDTSVDIGMSFLGHRPGVPERAPSLAPGQGNTAPAAWVGPPEWLSPLQRYEGVAEVQRKAAALARTAVGAAGPPILHFWQPNAFTRVPTDEERAQLESLGIDQEAFRTLRSVHEGVRSRLPADVIDLGDVLDDAPTVYADQVHTNEVGAALVARAMYRKARPTLDAREP